MRPGPRQRRRVLRLGLDVLLLGIAGLLVAAVVHDLRRQVTGLHRRQLDVRTFDGWARRQPRPAAFSRVRVVATRRGTDVVCGSRARGSGRICLAIRDDRRGPRVLAAEHVARGQRAVRHGRLNCRPRARPTCVTGGDVTPGATAGGG